MIKKVIFALSAFTVFSCQSEQELKTEQYFAEGYQIYTMNCANCHQADGKGMANLYPPLVGSKIIHDKSAMACIMKYGMKGTITVNGKPFNRPMPANAKLQELEIAEVITYVNMKWAKDSVYTPIATVTKALTACKEH
ncbi:c-type cytochrome [Dyadobacter subterraneus]|uniref:Cytochrome c n=1 Tax=Dyadobacter subterraneus TaxID=2773304 RepID=A0ABR9WFR0_9BACT|nr:cytochrome c [Dyadobacter subterraneus]MBE9464333.1 cytochrome c [Dyadobacter subterraneus]